MISELLSQFAVSLVSLINSLGYIGIFLGMVIESSFFPFPSEIILIPAGALVAEGKMNFFLVLFSGILGSLIGALINFSLALFLGRKAVDRLVLRYGKFFFLNEERLEKSDEYFKKNGEATTFIGRLIPGIRQLISLPAGFSKMNIFRFSFFTALGAGLWSLILVYAGFLAGNNILWLEQNLNLITLILISVSLIIILFYLLKRRNYFRKNKNS